MRIFTVILFMTIVTLAINSCSNHENRVGPPNSGAGYYYGIDSYIFSVPPLLDAKLSADPLTMLPDLVAFLVSNAANDRTKVKRLHDWIAANILYDYDCYDGSLHPDKCIAQTTDAVLRKRVAVCGGYAQLFVDMAALVPLNAKVVDGSAKDEAFYASGVLASGGNHAWNKIELGGIWQLIDVTWDSGGFKAAHATRNYNKTYFLADPFVFASEHFPNDSSDQLIQNSLVVQRTTPLSTSEFAESPAYQAAYFANSCVMTGTADGQTITPHDRMAVSKTLTLQLTCPGITYFGASYSRAGDQGIWNWIEPSVKQSVAEIAIDFSATGTYEIDLLGLATSGFYEPLVSFHVLVP